jgi:hypothetical protein
MNQRKLAKALSGAALAVGLFAILSFMPAERWQGHFSEASYRLKIINPDGTPIEGARLHVINERGTHALGYPVDEYRGAALISDSGGYIRFRHTTQPHEFGGECRHLFFLIEVGQCHAPAYECIIQHNSKSTRLSFNKLNEQVKVLNDLVDATVILK